MGFSEIPHSLRQGVGGLMPSAVSHQGASTDSQQLGSWVPTMASADADLLPELGILTARSRDLVRNNGVATSGIQTLVDNVVGVGLRLSSKPDWRGLGRTAEWGEDWQRNVERLWREFANSTDCDVARELNFAGLTELMFRNMLMDGDAITLPLWKRGRPGARFATCLQVVESDRLSNPDGRLDDANLRGGIEYSGDGEPLFYHIRKTHPGDYLLGAASVAGEWARIPARTAWGRKRVIHLHEKERTGQSRGKPLFAAVIQQFKMIDKYAGAELDAAVINAMMAAFIETEMGGAELMEMFGGADGMKREVGRRNKGRPKLKSGSVIPLYPGEKVQPFMPARPAAQFEAFVVAVLRQIAAALGLPYELLLKDFSRTNYSSARAALLEAWRMFRSKREKLAAYWAQPVFELWLEEAVNAGLVEAPGFYEKRAAYCWTRWIGPGRGWVDPVKEAQAAQIRMEIGVSTLEAECSEQGLDWEEVLEQRAREQKRIEELGLTPASAASISILAAAQPKAEEAANDGQSPGGAA
ncbi:phage portal protein [Chromobacterium vaccinii]|uniref:phage portal protein n=1 Tax=Chromobacterium vaccinii TaxID=1108595 RepID=UPI003C796682